MSNQAPKINVLPRVRAAENNTSSAAKETILRFSEQHTLLFWKPRKRKTQRVADTIDNIMDDSIEGENALASLTDERPMEDLQGIDDSTGKKQQRKS